MKTWSATALTVIESTINPVLRYDNRSMQRLAKMQGKVVLIDLQQPDWQCFVLPGGDGIQLQARCESEPDASLSARWSDLINYKLPGNAGGSVVNSDLAVTGDTKLLAELEALISELDIQWEDLLADLFGDLPAHEMHKVVHGSRSWAEETLTHRLDDLEAYIHDEAQWLPHRDEINHLFDEIDDVSLDTERFLARLNRLKTRIDELNSSGD